VIFKELAISCSLHISLERTKCKNSVSKTGFTQKILVVLPIFAVTGSPYFFNRTTQHRSTGFFPWP
jgi:hypothetical protein